MGLITAKPNEYLVIGRRGKIINLGLAASKWLWPGHTYFLIPGTPHEAQFMMTQESKNGIPLRFKGIVIYHVQEPEIAAKRFNFSNPSVLDSVDRMISDICLGELRDIVAKMNWRDCIDQRKTALTEVITNALNNVIEHNTKQSGWGLALDIAQVAQVYIVDEETRTQLEAETLNAIKADSDLSDIQMREKVQIAKTASENRLLQESLTTEQQQITVKKEKLQLNQQLKQAEIEHQQTLQIKEIEAKTPIKLLEMEKRREVLSIEKELLILENEVETLKGENQMILPRLAQAVDLEKFQAEQPVAMAKALANMHQGGHVTLVGEGASSWLATTATLTNQLLQTLKTQGAADDNAESND